MHLSLFFLKQSQIMADFIRNKTILIIIIINFFSRFHHHHHHFIIFCTDITNIHSFIHSFFFSHFKKKIFLVFSFIHSFFRPMDCLHPSINQSIICMNADDDDDLSFKWICFIINISFSKKNSDLKHFLNLLIMLCITYINIWKNYFLFIICEFF